MSEDNERRQPAYWAVLPAPVRYATDIGSGEKLLFAELSALAESYGYCWANNDYFARLYGKDERTVIRWLNRLEEHGYIRIENMGTTKRRIFCGVNPLNRGTDKNVTGTDKNVTGTDKNVTAIYNTKEEQDKGTDPPKPPKGAKRAPRRRVKSACEYRPEIFERFWKKYPRGDDKAGARYEWDELRPDPALMREMSAALDRWLKTDEWRRGVGIPYACRWLRERRWEWEINPLPGAEPPPEREREEQVEWMN